jgi:glucose-specific phosphotransferase system IIA component
MAKLTIAAPLTGRLIPLQEVPDEAFAQGMMGEGVAIDPTVGEVRSPISGTVEMVFPTGHAVALRTPEGAEILVHVGIDSAHSGAFQIQVEAGAAVKQGDLLITFDVRALKAKAKSHLSPVILTTVPDGMSLRIHETTEVKAGETPIIDLI